MIAASGCQGCSLSASRASLSAVASSPTVNAARASSTWSWTNVARSLTPPKPEKATTAARRMQPASAARRPADQPLQNPGDPEGSSRKDRKDRSQGGAGSGRLRGRGGSMPRRRRRRRRAPPPSAAIPMPAARPGDSQDEKRAPADRIPAQPGGERLVEGEGLVVVLLPVVQERVGLARLKDGPCQGMEETSCRNRRRQWAFIAGMSAGWPPLSLS